jgi:guanylate kinase
LIREKKGAILILSGPSGCGKSTLLKEVYKNILEQRLNTRNTDSAEIIEKRIKNAKGEVEFFQDYDYLIINNNLETAAKELVCIANIARIKTKLFNKEKIVSNWLN